MNHQIETFARNNLKEGLVLLPPHNQRIFKLMYGRNNGRRSVPDAEAMEINAVVDEIPAPKLDWAMTQVERSLLKTRDAVPTSEQPISTKET